MTNYSFEKRLNVVVVVVAVVAVVDDGDRED